MIVMIVMIVKKDDPCYKKAIDHISNLFRISCILNIVWIASFSFVLVEISSLFILGFVVALALIGIKLLEIREGKHWLLPLSFGLYSGWLFIATVVNIAAALTKLGWNGFGLSQGNLGKHNADYRNCSIDWRTFENPQCRLPASGRLGALWNLPVFEITDRI